MDFSRLSSAELVQMYKAILTRSVALEMVFKRFKRGSRLDMEAWAFEHAVPLHDLRKAREEWETCRRLGGGLYIEIHRRGLEKHIDVPAPALDQRR